MSTPYQMPRRAHPRNTDQCGDGGGSQLERRRMSERRSIPPMQYAPPEDGHVNHGAVGVKEALTIPAGGSRLQKQLANANGGKASPKPSDDAGK